MDEFFLKVAIGLSQESVCGGGYPVGAVLVFAGRLVSSGISDGKSRYDATSHAEINAIRRASLKLRSRDLKGSVIYSSMEPCVMCFSACYWAGVQKIVYACSKQKVSGIHYEGLEELGQINSKNKRSITLVHINKFESAAVNIIRGWEDSIR